MILFYCLQEKLIYKPAKQLVASPSDFSIDFEEVRFPSEDGTILHGWFFHQKDSKDVILFCHGNAGNISHYLDTARLFLDNKKSIFLFDYRGFGLSENKPLGEKETYIDSNAAYLWLKNSKKYLEENIIVLGRSLGGAQAAYVARKNAPKALILESAFPSLIEIGKELYPWLPVFLLSRIKYKTLDNTRFVTCPVLVVHSQDDELIPFKFGQKLFEFAPEPKQFIQINGDHNEGYFTSGSLYINGLLAFFSKIEQQN